jgi:hypothetical protein
MDRFEGVILQGFLADFIPEGFLRVEFWRVERQEEQQDIVGNCEISTAMIGRAVENQEDILPGKAARQDTEELWKQVVFEIGTVT